MPDYLHPCRCRRGKRIDNGRRYGGEGRCVRCDGRFGKPRGGTAIVLYSLPRIRFNEETVPGLHRLRLHLFRAAGLLAPSQYKGMGGFRNLEDHPLRHFLIGYVEGTDRTILADALFAMRNEMTMDLIKVLRG